MRPPEVYRAISAITAELVRSGIAKSHINVDELYAYRSIDDLLDRLAPLLAQHRLCILPRVLERISTERQGFGGSILVNVTLKVAFDLVSAEDASSHTVEAYGEALDDSDKGTAKAMSSAYKAAMLQAFCVPVQGADDSDRRSPKIVKPSHDPAPVQGWDQWCQEIMDLAGACESEQALLRVQESYRTQLKGLSRGRPDLYAQLGASFAERRTVLSHVSTTRQLVRPKAGPGRRQAQKTQPREPSGTSAMEVGDAVA